MASAQFALSATSCECGSRFRRYAVSLREFLNSSFSVVVLWVWFSLQAPSCAPAEPWLSHPAPSCECGSRFRLHHGSGVLHLLPALWVLASGSYLWLSYRFQLAQWSGFFTASEAAYSRGPTVYSGIRTTSGSGSTSPSEKSRMKFPSVGIEPAPSAQRWFSR